MKNPHQIIKTPLLSEKLQRTQAEGIYGFVVAKSANKVEIKHAVETLYKVKVSRVNIINLPGKKRRLRFKTGLRPSWKKSFVRLKKGQTISFG